MKLLTITEFASMVGMSIYSLRRWEKQGRLSCVRTLGGQRRYTEEMAVELLKTKSKNNEEED